MQTNWNAIFSIAIAVALLVTVEFLPAGLLTPISEELAISPGVAGQTLTITAIFAVISSLFASSVAGRVDRRYVVLCFTFLLILSTAMTALSSSFAMVIAARVLLGLALGGFWAMSAYITMKLAAPEDIPKALSIVFGGVSVALVLATPAGSFLGAIVGWRGVFLIAAGLGAVCIVWQWFVIPAIPAQQQQSALAALLVFKRAQVPAAMLAIFAVFAGQIGFFTYIRPFLESVVQLDVNGISLMLLLFGIANFAGTSLSSRFLQRSLKTTLAYSPLVLALCALMLVVGGHNHILAGLVIVIWGFTFGLVPVGWSTWVTRSLSDDAESAGGLQVAVIQIANASGAAVGGLLLDFSGPKGPLEASILFLIIAGLTVLIRLGHSSAKITQPASE
ncbi:MFS transporter [Alteromonas sp. 1_MG-2023]|uniref:MFS transporter n=1 Tax=Alteromonas sp. 1_MG-2023 TaxID=3062669 RepID=UPI0026E3300F|nr:MFS transporter [Alteromonas sp. 1_MG-2023]MDO6474503.1 MFS transporter [Alteromonas sp. 1_MG-2023]